MTDEARDSPTPKKDNAFSEIVKRVSRSFAPKETHAPQVDLKTLESYAEIMSNAGYEMSESALQILNEYLKGYNLWLCGNVGVGKTFFFDCMNKIRWSRGLSPIIKLSMVETQGWTMDAAVDWTKSYVDYDVLIDDLGAEPMLNHYGEKVEVFPYILEKRMQLPHRTHLTSNLGPSDILRRYERRVADRFALMFKMIEMKAKKSRRRLTVWRRPEAGEVVL